MWTMAALMSAQLELLRDNLYQATKDTIETLESKDKDMGPVDIAQVQAWLLLAMYEFMQTYHRRGWMSAGRAFRLMQLLRLDEIDNVNSAAGWYDPKAQDDWIAKEEKRRTFWMAYCLDRVISIHSSMPLTLSEHVVSGFSRDSKYAAYLYFSDFHSSSGVRGGISKRPTCSGELLARSYRHHRTENPFSLHRMYHLRDALRT